MQHVFYENQDINNVLGWFLHSVIILYSFLYEQKNNYEQCLLGFTNQKQTYHFPNGNVVAFVLRFLFA